MRIQAVLAASLLVACLPAFAEQTKYTETAILSGTIGGTTFTDQLVTFSQLGGTIIPISTYSYYDEDASPTVTIAGIGTADMLGSQFGIFFEQLPTHPYAPSGFEDPETGFKLITGVPSSFTPADLGGMVTGPLSLEESGPESTSLGALTFDTPPAGETSTLTSGPVPEVPSLVMLGTGLLGVLGAVRRRV